MKINDIPQLIHVQGGCSWELESIKPTLERFEETYGLDLNPEFQRDHVWNMQTKILCMEYILRGGIVQPIRFNSPAFGGHRHSKNSDLSEAVVLVDGKQRLNAAMEFMDNKIAVFGGNFLRDFDNPDLLLRRVGFTYQVNKLQTKKELYQWYLEMNEGQVAHTAAELQKVRDLLAGKE